MTPDPITRCAHLISQGKLAEAEDICRDLLRRNPANPDAHGTLGTIRYFEKRYESAREHMQRALAGKPEFLDARNVLGLVRMEHDRDIEGAAREFEDILRTAPEYVNAWVNLGNIHYNTYRYDRARQCYERVLALDPDNFYALNNLGSILATSGQYAEGIELFKRAFALRENDQELLGNLMNFLMLGKRWGEAYELLPKFMRTRNPGLATFTAYNFCKLGCLWEQEQKLLPQVLSMISRGNVSIHAFENVNLSLLANPNVTIERLFEIHKAAGEAMRKLRTRKPHEEHGPAFARRGKIRIGYLSPDFRAHAVNNFFRGIINAHDRDCFEIFLYSSVAPDSCDETTEQYRQVADCHVDANVLNDEELAQRIHDDGIQILVDLAGFTFRSRIAVMAYQPAPVQVSYIGYPYTSGLREIDYFLSSEHLDGPRNRHFFTEAQLHLPDSPFTFDSLTVQPIEPVPPFERNGRITFGTLNNPYKYSPRLVGVWSGILRRVTGSRLVINHPSCNFIPTRQSLLDAFAAQGIAADRIDIVWEKHPKVSHLHYYNDIDISLDTFPLTGGTTTVDVIWMGVPTVTLVGDVYYQRLSYSFLMNTGVDVSDLCAFSEAEYADKAVALAGNPERMRELRARLPQTLKRSVLRDSIRLTRNLEAALVEGWNRKFPARKLDLAAVPDGDRVEWVELPGAVRLATIDPAADQESYIVREHLGWYDAEYPFFLDLVAAGARVLDIGSGLGAYALPAARRAGAEGQVWMATLSPREARLAELGRSKNGIGNLRDLTLGRRKMILDDDAQRFGIEAVDLVRINPAISGHQLLECAGGFFGRESPVVMFGSARAESYAKQGAAEPFFRGLGYGIYRYVPGIGGLAPVPEDEELDVMAINVFACKPDRAQDLAARGLLATATPPLGDLPPLDDPGWLRYLGGFPYARGRLDAGPAATQDQGDLYRLALTLYARSQESGRTPIERYADLAAAYGTLTSVVQVAPSLARHLSRIRMMFDLNLAGQAVTALQEVLQRLESGATLELGEPFLALSARHAALDPQDRLGDWLVASLLETFEVKRSFSSWFTGQDSLQRLELLCTTGFQSEAMERRLALLRQRLSNPAN